MNKKENRKIQRIFLTEKIYYEENVESKKISNKKNRYEIFIINIECSLLLRSHIFVSHMDGFLSNFYFSKHPSNIVSTSLHVHAHFHNFMFAKCGVKNRRGFLISVDTRYKNNRKVQRNPR